MSADARVVIHLLTLKCGPPSDKEPSREEIKLAERMASILKDFEARQLEVDEQLEVVEKEAEDWDPHDELMDVERQASSGHMITFSGGTLVSEERAWAAAEHHRSTSNKQPRTRQSTSLWFRFLRSDRD